MSHSSKSGSVLFLLTVVVVLAGCPPKSRRVSTPVALPFHDDFSDPSTLSKYRIFDERLTDEYEIANGKLKIRANEKQDLWGGYTGGNPRKRGAPLLLIEAPDDSYSVEAFVTATNTSSPDGPQALNTQVGLFVFRDIDNWLFWGFTNHEFGTDTVGDGFIATLTHEGNSTIVFQWVDEPEFDAAILRLRKIVGPAGDRFQLSYRANATDPWILLGSVPFTPDHGTEEVGLGVKTFDLSDWEVSNMGLGFFDDFRIDTY